MKTLLQGAPSLEERAKKAKTSRRQPGASGSLHRTEAGDWVWSSDDEGEHPSNKESNECPDNAVSNETPKQINQNHKNEKQEQLPVENDTPVQNNKCESTSINLVLRIRNSKRELNDIRFEFTPDKGKNQIEYCNLCYSTETKRICKCILITSLSYKDTCEGIAQELIGAGLVDSRDLQVVSLNLETLIKNYVTCKIVKFALVSF